MSPFDFTDSILITKKKIDRELTVRHYLPFIINRSLSFGVDTVMYANEMNLNSHIDKKLQYDYLFHMISKRNSKNRWIKKSQDETLTMIREHYNCTIEKAREAMSILSKEQIEEIKKKSHSNEFSRYAHRDPP